MSWNNRVQIDEHQYPDGTKEYCATIHEVFYDIERGVGSTAAAITPMGSAFSKEEAIESLKFNLELMLEAVNFVIEGKTTVYDYENKETHNPGASSLVIRKYDAKNAVLDKDDAYMDEKYDEED
ncbi:hypothetical protein GAP32_388 [Cronobacter phage vB_CsaM_GAP32]|uniref:Uncharacterized protein n=1 Tax=Cronobacter phage vB_CsaM_GAP32 TaxID=1141136 RepID=K4F9N9_9CAUD|nr:hypothetical protein GAP32_388 [Cronobacter phage vB_CsaM_GAP32]AFC21840.1 hypothetical protein GAP32_388 [Cronobacter phage vB_CsaM_GAP32]